MKTISNQSYPNPEVRDRRCRVYTERRSRDFRGWLTLYKHIDITSFQPPRLIRWCTCTSKHESGGSRDSHGRLADRERFAATGRLAHMARWAAARRRVPRLLGMGGGHGAMGATQEVPQTSRDGSRPREVWGHSGRPRDFRGRLAGCLPLREFPP
jgi:hypothetical protein